MKSRKFELPIEGSFGKLPLHNIQEEHDMLMHTTKKMMHKSKKKESKKNKPTISKNKK